MTQQKLKRGFNNQKLEFSIINSTGAYYRSLHSKNGFRRLMDVLTTILYFFVFVFIAFFTHLKHSMKSMKRQLNAEQGKANKPKGLFAPTQRNLKK